MQTTKTIEKSIEKPIEKIVQIPDYIEKNLNKNLDMINKSLNERHGGTDYIDFLTPDDFVDKNGKTHKIIYGKDIFNRFFIATQCNATHYTIDGVLGTEKRMETIVLFQRYGRIYFGLKPLYIAMSSELYTGYLRSSSEMNDFSDIFAIINGRPISKIVEGEKILFEQI